MPEPIAKPAETVPVPTGGHDWSADKDVEDKVEKMIRDTGCWDQHLATVDCMGEKRDWRKCQVEVLAFKECVAASRKPSSPPAPAAAKKEAPPSPSPDKQKEK